MHAEMVTHALLIASAPLVAAVPAASIYPHVVMQGVALPAIGATFVDAIDIPTIDARGPVLKQARMSVEVHARDYAEKKTILGLVRTAMRYQRGIIAGVPVASIVGAGDGPDLDSTDEPIYRQAIDFFVTFTEN